MFDLITGKVDRPFRDARVMPTVVSVAVHAVVVGALTVGTLFVVTDSWPEAPTVMAFVADIPAPQPPPPPPPPPAPKAPKPPQEAQPTLKAGLLAAPVAAPLGIFPATGMGGGEEDGVPGGIEGGIPGGLLGGVVGGLLTEVIPPPPPLPPPPRAPVRIGGDVKAPTLLRRVEPVYPEIAVAASVTGLVILEATVNEQGEVIDVRILRSRPLLDKAATEAVRQWRYSPLLLNGTPWPFVLTVTLRFSIS